MSKVSVIIPAFNVAKFIKGAIESVFNQTYKNIEIIVVDDGSTDATREIVNSFGDKVMHIDQSNQGHAIARNTGLKVSSGRYCAFLDADDYWLPEKVEQQVRILNEMPDVGIVHCDIKRIDDEGREIKQYPRREEYIDGKIFPYLLMRKGHIATSSAMFRKECIEKHGLLDDSVRDWGSEDREFWLRICKHYKVKYIGEPLVIYRQRKRSLSRSRSLSNIIKGRYWAIDKSLEDVRPLYYSWFLKRSSYSAIHKEVGYKFLWKFDFKMAKKHYLTSLHCWPFDRYPWIGLVRSLLKIKITPKYN